MTPNSRISSALDAFAKAWEATSAGLLLATALLVCMVALLAFIAASATVLHINNDVDAWRKGRVFGASILAGELAVIVFLGVKSGQSAGALYFDLDEIVPAALILAGVAFIYPLMGIAANKVAEQLQKFAIPGPQEPWSQQVLLTLLPFWPFVLAYWIIMTPLLSIIDRVGGETG